MTDKRPPRFGKSSEPNVGRPAGGRNRKTTNTRSGGGSDKNPDRKPRAEQRTRPSGGGKPSRGGDTRNQARSAAPATRSANSPDKHRGAGGNRRGGAGRETKSGLEARYLALTILEAVIRDQTSLDAAIPEALADERFAHLEARDKAFARLLAMTVLRHHKNLQAIVDTFLAKPLSANAERIRIILLAGAAELTILKIAPHAAISTAVDLTRLSAKTLHFDRLANAILRRVSEKGAALLESLDASGNFPDWMINGWREAYGEETASRIAAASLTEAALDLSAKEDAVGWASRLDAIVLATGTLRRATGGRIEDLDGYREGGWWVQDAAAALPARLLNADTNSRILDLCAAPGGKTAQLCATGAAVTAVDVSATRMQRLRANLDRLGFDAISVASDAATWRSTERFDGILIDAPCTATGTIRRHPDILHLKRSGDIQRLNEMQDRLLNNAASLVNVGGTIVYCTCSLEPAECEQRINAFLDGPHAGKFERRAITAQEIANQSDWLTPKGDLRTFPFHLPHENPALAGIDGFYAARLVRTA